MNNLKYSVPVAHHQIRSQWQSRGILTTVLLDCFNHKCYFIKPLANDKNIAHVLKPLLKLFSNYWGKAEDWSHSGPNHSLSHQFSSSTLQSHRSIEQDSPLSPAALHRNPPDGCFGSSLAVSRHRQAQAGWHQARSKAGLAGQFLHSPKGEKNGLLHHKVLFAGPVGFIKGFLTWKVLITWTNNSQFKGTTVSLSITCDAPSGQAKAPEVLKVARFYMILHYLFKMN